MQSEKCLSRLQKFLLVAAIKCANLESKGVFVCLYQMEPPWKGENETLYSTGIVLMYECT